MDGDLVDGLELDLEEEVSLWWDGSWEATIVLLVLIDRFVD